MDMLIVSNHTLIGRSLIYMLENLAADERIDAEFCAPSAVVATAQARHVDLILVEAIADFAEGIGTVRAVKEALPQALVVVLGTEEDEASIFEAISAGADGYLTRATSAEALLATLRGVARGELGLSRIASLRVVRQLSRVARSFTPRIPDTLGAKLTQREQEVFDLVRHGLRSREIAERLCIAEATVYKHIQNVLDKLHVHNRTQAILMTEKDIPAANTTAANTTASHRRASARVLSVQRLLPA